MMVTNNYSLIWISVDKVDIQLIAQLKEGRSTREVASSLMDNIIHKFILRKIIIHFHLIILIFTICYTSSGNKNISFYL